MVQTIMGSQGLPQSLLVVLAAGCRHLMMTLHHQASHEATTYQLSVCIIASVACAQLHVHGSGSSVHHDMFHVTCQLGTGGFQTRHCSAGLPKAGRPAAGASS